MRSSLIAAGAATLALVAAGCGSASSDSASDRPRPQGAGKVKLGDLAALGTQKAAIKQLKATDAYCQWDGSHVHVHVVFKNGLNAHVTVKVNPAYTLANAGAHGIGITNEQSVGIDAKATRDWDGDAGSPDGVSGNPRIVKCSPRIQDVELG